MIRIPCVLALGIAIVLAINGTSVADPLAPIPPVAAIAAAEKTVRSVYKADYVKTKTADQIEFARKLLKAAETTTDDPAGRYVLLQEARNIAARAGDVTLAMDAVAATCREFAVDRADITINALETTLRAPSSPNTTIVEIAMAEVEHQIEVDEYLTAGRLVKIAANAAGRTSSSALSATVAGRGRDVEAMRQGFEAIEKERTILAKAPNDPVAAGRVGRFLCLLKGDWPTGLPLLARSEDEVLKAIAKKDLAGPTDVPTQVEVGDAWYDLGEGYDPRERAEARLRAFHWYQEAAPFLTGLTKDRVDKRVEELAKIAATRSPRSEPNAWMVLFRSDDPTIWNTDTKRAGGQFAVPLARAPINTQYLRMTETKKGEYVIIEMTRQKLDRAEQNNYGWIGAKEHFNNADHLGIYNKGWGKADRGDIMVFNIPNKVRYRGWGFGHRRLQDDIQGFAWNGKTVEKTVFEIAVKATALTPAESRYLLKKK